MNPHAFLGEKDLLKLSSGVHILHIEKSKELYPEEVIDLCAEGLEQWMSSLLQMGKIPLYFWPFEDSNCPLKVIENRVAEKEEGEAVLNPLHEEKTFLARLENPGNGGDFCPPEIFVCSPVKISQKILGFAGIPFFKHSPTGLYYLLSSLLGTAISMYFQLASLSLLLKEKNNKIEHLRKKIVQAQEEERKLIAFEIHDVISQRAAAIFYRIQTVEQMLRRKCLDDIEEELSGISKMAQVMVDDVTRLMFDLKPPHLEELGVEASLRRYIDQLKREYGITVDLKVLGPLDKLWKTIKLTTYRIVQEALTNIRKHARVHKASVVLQTEDDKLLGQVIDEGAGFDPEKVNHEKCMGIMVMKERALLVGGTFEVLSEVGKGTCIRFVLPVTSPSKEEIKNEPYPPNAG